MVKYLKLKDAALDVYAMIYEFTKDGKYEFVGTIQYICERLEMSKPTIIKALKELISSELIIRRKLITRTGTQYRYRANLRIAKLAIENHRNSIKIQQHPPVVKIDSFDATDLDWHLPMDEKSSD